MPYESNYAASLAESMKISIRKHLIDYKDMTVLGNCQTSQAFMLYMNLFEKDERKKAEKKLLEIIHKDGDVTYLGMIGVRVIFHVLTSMGEYNLCYKMITSKKSTAYGYWIKCGATSLWECFKTKDEPFTNSKNHHFLGDISSWFIRKVAGIDPNPKACDISYFEITPHFIDALSFAEADYDSAFGKVYVKWERINNIINLKITIPSGIKGKIKLPKGYSFEDGKRVISFKKENKTQNIEIQIKKSVK